MKSAAGLYLWSVGLNNGTGCSLWITTSKFDVGLATRKAETFLRKFRKQEKCPHATIRSIVDNGTIDA